MVSIVLPTYRGTQTIDRCLDALLPSTAERSYELIIVDSSDDETADLIDRRIRGVPRTRLIRSETRLSVGEARNRGVGEASGEIIAFVDQDCLVPRHWAQKLVLALQENDVDGVGGSLGMANPGNLSGAVLYFLEFMGFFPSRGAPRSRPRFLLGCNAAYRRSVVRRVPFPEINMGEDVIFSAQVRGCGFETLYEPSIQVEHINRTGWRTVFAYLGRLGRASARYHQILALSRAKLFFRLPPLVFLVPLHTLAKILLELARGGKLSYLLLFVALLPACLLGSYVWAYGFFRQAQITAPGAAPDRWEG